MIDVSRPVREPLGVVVDYMGGTCGEVLPGILAAVGVRETAIDAAPMPNGSSYQDRHARTARLRRIVPAVGAAFGALLDADGNRSWIVDERGEPLDSFEAIGLLLRAKQELGRVGAWWCRSPSRPACGVCAVARLRAGSYQGRDSGGHARRGLAERDPHRHRARCLCFPELHAGPDPMAFVGQLAAYLGAHEHSVSGDGSRVPAVLRRASGGRRRVGTARRRHAHAQRTRAASGRGRPRRGRIRTGRAAGDRAAGYGSTGLPDHLVRVPISSPRAP